MQFYIREIKFQAPGLGGRDGVELGSPIDALDGTELNALIVTETGDGHEDGLAVLLTDHLIAVDAILRGPLPSAVVDQLLVLISSRHAPRSAPVGMCGIVGGCQTCNPVADVILEQKLGVTPAPHIGSPGIDLLGLDLASGEVSAES